MLIRNKAFTLVEVTVVIFISLVIFSAVFMALSTGELSNTVGSTRIDVQQEVRRALDWMAKDMRQTHRMFMNVTDEFGGLNTFVGIADNSVFSDPDFQLCEGYNVTTGTNEWSDYTIFYAFNPTTEIITRTDSDTGQVLRFNNINNLTFTKLGMNLLKVDIVGRRVAKSTPSGNITQFFNLSEEVRFRND